MKTFVFGHKAICFCSPNDRVGCCLRFAAFFCSEHTQDEWTCLEADAHQTTGDWADFYQFSEHCRHSFNISKNSSSEAKLSGSIAKESGKFS